MKVLITFWRWLGNLFHPRLSKAPSERAEIPNQIDDAFRYVIVDDVPSVFQDKCVYILNEGYVDEAIYFVCPCGCNAVIELNLLEDSKPLWKYAIDNGRITISPSVWRRIECKSHFFIRSGKIQWANP